jgi:3-oxoacyl-[acyl-carrier-protein] synthase-3
VLAELKDAASALPPDQLDLLLYSSQRKLEFLGIETRAYTEDISAENFITMGVKAAAMAIDQAGVPVEQIDCVIVSGVSNPFREPPAACIIAGMLGIAQTDFFDVNDTCNGFMTSMRLAHQIAAASGHRNVLVVASESPWEYQRATNATFTAATVDEYDFRLANLIVGAGAAAMVIGTAQEGHRILGHGVKRETANWDASLLRLPGAAMPPTRYGHDVSGFWSNARLISSEVIAVLPGFIRERLASWHTRVEDIDLFLMHQLGDNVNYAILSKLDVPRERSPVNTFRELGNMGSANIPVCLSTASQQGRLAHGTKALLVGSACGISYSLALLQW